MGARKRLESQTEEEGEEEMRPPLAGLTLPMEYQSALQNWHAESRERKRAIKAKPNDESLPLARGFFSYASDPDADGDDRDSLLLEPWWDSAQAGRNEKMLNLYKLQLRDQVYNAEGVGEHLKAIATYGLESIAPTPYVKTTMSDYIPSQFNIFMDADGNRTDPSKQTSAIKRTGTVLLQGVTGYALIGGTAFVGLMFMPKIINWSLESAESFSVGVLEIVEKVGIKAWDIASLRGARKGQIRELN